MSRKNQNARIQFKYSTIGGTEPTIAPSMDHTDGTWSPTDLYVGEFFLNAVDDTMWVRTLTGIIPLTSGTTSVDISTFVNKTGDTMTGELVLPTMSATTGIYSPYIYSDVYSGGTYYGDGSNLTNIPYTTFTGGTVNGYTTFTNGVDLTSASVSANTIDTAGGLNFIGGDVSVGNNLDVTGAVTATTYYGDGSNLTGLNISGFTGYWEIEPVNQNSIKTTFGSNTFAGNPEYGILGGNFSAIRSSNNSVVLGLKNEAIGAPQSHILANSSNTLSGSTYASIFGGDDNNVLGQYSSIFGGSSNTLDDTDYSIISGGRLNTINATTSSRDYNSIVGGINNVITDCVSSFISSSSSSITGGANYGAILGGTGNNMDGVDYGFILGGNGNTNDGQNYSGIIGGFDNTIDGSTSSSVIVGGVDNLLDDDTYGFITAGYQNIIRNNSVYSTIIGSNQTSIVNGYNTAIISHHYSGKGTQPTNLGRYGSVMLGGMNNYITSNNSQQIIIGGFDNTSDGATNVILGGRDGNNRGLYSTIVGGEGNGIDNGVSNSVVLGGQNITATTDSTVYVDNLNINTLGTGTSVNNLGIDTNGNVVTGSGGGGSSLWTQSGTSIYYNTGNVGIGTDTPQVELHVKGDNSILRLETISATNDSYVEFWDPTERKGFLGYVSTINTDAFFLRNEENGADIIISTTNSGGTSNTAIDIDGNQNVGIPNGNLDVSGQVSVGTDTGNVFTTNTFDFDCDLGMVQEVDGQGMTGNGTITFSNEKEGSTYTTIFIQGSGLYDVDLGSGYWLNDTAPFDFTTLADNERAMITATRLNSVWYFAVKNLTFV